MIYWNPIYIWFIYIHKTVVCVSVCSQLIGLTRFPAPHSEIDWRAGHRAGMSERAKQERKRCWNRIRCQYYEDALQKVEEMIAFFVNSLPFVFPMEEVMKPYAGEHK